MKQLSFKNLKMHAALFMLFAFLIAGVGKSYAAAVDFGEMTLGQEYSYEAFKSFTGHFTAPQTGKVYIAGPMGAELYTDAELSESASNYTFVGYGPYTVSYDVEANNTYYLAGSEMDNGTVKVYMDGVGEQPLELLVCTPAENGTYDLASDAAAILTLQFNHVMNVNSGWVLKYVGADGSAKSADYTGAQANNKFVSVPVQSKVLALLKSGAMKANTAIEICLSGLQTESGMQLEDHLNAEGQTVFHYTVGDIPMTKVSEVVPSSFLSYWVPGSEAAKFEVTFDGEIGQFDDTELLIQYGSAEIDKGYYSESVPYTIEGSKLTADLSGKLRTPLTMLPETLMNFPTVTLRLQNVKDKSGQSVSTGNQGSVGSFDWMIPYKLLDRASVACEFTPANGASLLNKTEIELWVNGLNTISFSGFRFESDGQTVTVPVAEADFEKGDTDDEGIYVFAIPTSMRGKKGVRVTLADVVAADGYDHSDDVRALYDSFTLMFSSPANGAQMGWINEGDIIKIEANCAAQNPEMCVVYEIEDLNPEDPDEAMLKSFSYMQRQDDGSYISEVFGDYKMLVGHRYKATFSAWETESAMNYGEESLGSDYVIWEGETLPYKYSPLTLVSITPAPGTKLTASDRVFNLKFDGYVTLDPSTTFINRGMGMSEPFESIEAVNPQTGDDGVDFSDEWNLTVSESYMAALTAALDISFKPVDQDGLLLLGTHGKEETTYFYYSFDTASRYMDVNVYLPGHEEQPTAVSEIWVSQEMGVLPSYTLAPGDAYVVNKSREVVARVADYIIPINDVPIEEVGDKVNTEVGLVLDNEITAPGAYYFVAPANYFSLGKEFNPYNSNEIFWAFSISGAQSGELPHAMNITPAPGKVAELQTIEIIFTDEDEISIGSGIITLSINGETAKTFDAELDWDLWNKANIDLGETYTEDGTYTLSFPAGYFVLGSNGDRGSEAFTLEYTIGGTVGDELPHVMEITPAPGAVPSLSTIEIIFSEEDEISIGSGMITLHVNDVEHSRHDAELDWDLWNKAVLDLGETHTAEGTYKVSFPAGYFVLGSNGDRGSEAFDLKYNITPSGIQSITLTTASGKVYDLSGNLRKDTNLPAGVYIVDGKKVMVK